MRKRVHTREEGVAAGGAARLGNIVHEDSAFVADAVDVRRFAYHQATVVDAGLHPADVVTHDEKYVWFTGLALRICRRVKRQQRNHWCQ